VVGFVPLVLVGGAAYGATGVAWAATMIVVSQNLLLLVLAQQRLGINTSPALRIRSSP
jgi:hypothetical protein